MQLKESAMLIPEWAKCQGACVDGSSCDRVASWSVIQPWGVQLLCGVHRKDFKSAEKLGKGWWKHERF